MFKKRCEDLASKYRPVSLTLLVGKLLGARTWDKINSHLDKCGFGKSCLTDLIEF